MEPDSNDLMAIDAAAILLVSAAICLWSDKLLLMTILIPALIVIRIALVIPIIRKKRISLKSELIFLGICIVLGGFNDWNSVCYRKIYHYSVPHYFDFSSIPIWMLLYWGMILRFVARLARWKALGARTNVSDRIGIAGRGMESGGLRVSVELLVILATRAAIYRFHGNPFLSWFPFLIALGVMLVTMNPDRHTLKLLVITLIGGPFIEILYINVGDLHSYEHGFIGGVPLWIILWWLAGLLIWKDLAFRAERFLRLRLA